MVDELRINNMAEPGADLISDINPIQEIEMMCEAESAPVVPTVEVVQEVESVPVVVSGSEPARETEQAYQAAAVTARSKPSRRKESRSFKSAAILVVLGAVLGGFSLGAGYGVVTTAARAFFLVIEEDPAGMIQPLEPPTEVLAFSHQSNQPSVMPSLDESMPGSFSDVIKMVKPSVVSISSVMGGNQDFFSMPDTPKGSGIIFKEDDEKVYIITNYHVVGGAQSVSVSISGAMPVNAGLIGREQSADLAVLYVLKEDLREVGIHGITVAMFGDSDYMQEGDIVLAIGNAMGEGNSTTQGIISVMSKDIRVEGKELTVIQTDAAINPGNSGGALVNMRGEVIGINTAKTMNSPLRGLFDGLGGSAAEGMGYSIASNVVIPVVSELMLMKPRPFLGIRGDTVSEEIASLYSIPVLGVLVEEVIPSTSAEVAGLKRTDIITAFNGQPIFTMTDLQSAIRECVVGEDVEINILRDGKTQMRVQVKMLASDDTNF